MYPETVSIFTLIIYYKKVNNKSQLKSQYNLNSGKNIIKMINLTRLKDNAVSVMANNTLLI